jgi:hypothetical protein
MGFNEQMLPHLEFLGNRISVPLRWQAKRTMEHAYDDIGSGYAQSRRSDPRLAARILEALRGGDRVINVGAGAGSYEPGDRFVVAAEPSMMMLGQPLSEPGRPAR